MYRKLSFKKSHDLTVDTIIKIQEDLENSRASGQEILIKDPVVRREQFQATKRWNTILTQFYNDMPRKTNRRQLKFYSDSFTGKEATDFLLQLFPKVVPNKPFSLTNAEKFMQLLITKNLVENVRDAKNKTFTSNATLYKFLNDKIRAEIDETKPMPRSSSLTDLKNLSSGSFKEKLLKTKRRSHSFSMSNNPFNTSKTPLVDVQEVSDTTISRSQRPAVKPNPVDQVVEDQDYLMAWKNLLLKMVGVQSICDMMEDHLYGAHIKWNCTEIGERGIVKCPKTSDDLPNEVKKGFKILSEWKRGDELECSPNQVFDTLFKKLCVTIPIIPSYANPKFAVFWKFFHRRAVQNEYENVFYRNDDPGLSFASSSTFTGSSLSSESEGLRFIDEMETPVVSGRTRRNMPSGHQEMTDIKERFFAGLQVLLLSLKPDVRRRLNMICRYVKRCQENINLKLHESKTNREYLIEKLALCIVDFEGKLSMRDTILFVITLIDNNSRLFSGSATLIYSARRFYMARTRNLPAPQPVEFSNRIKMEDYSKQATTNDALLATLDELIANQNLKPSDKKKKLDSFKITYPTLYAIRFPNEKLNESGDAKISKKKDRPPTPTGKLVQRIRSLTRRDSAKSH